MRLDVRGVTKAFGATKALAHVDLEASAGEVHAVLGENGAGKSTLMKVLAGAETPDGGAVTLDGVAFRPGNPAEARRAGVSLVSQELSLCPHMTVAENVVLGEEPTRGLIVDRARMKRDVDAVLAEVSGGRIDGNAVVSRLPIAEQQLVEIARALVHRKGEGASRCKVLILDEPTSSLGREDTERLFALLAKLRGEGISIVYISHFLEEVLAVADRYTVLRDGATVGKGATAGTTTSQLASLMAGRKIEQLFSRAPRELGDVVLSLDGVASHMLPSFASLTLRRGEVFGIAGLVGAGRSELLRAIFGLLPVTRGEVRVKSFSGAATPAQRLAQGVGLLSEDRKEEGLATLLSIADNITLSRLDGLGPFPGLVFPKAQREAAELFVKSLSIRCRDASQRVADLSGGNQQKVALARLLRQDVDVLLLDEPTRGIDVGAKAQIYALIETLAREGKAVLMVSSYLPELLGTCDRIAVMCRGRLGEARATEHWTEHALLEQALGKGAA